MQMANVPNVITDPQKNIRYEVFAYRELTQVELIRMVRVFIANNKRKIKKNTRFQIYTSIGARGD